MLRITQNDSPQGAAKYFKHADYYSEGQELVGVWRGKGAERLGLAGEIAEKDWAELCDNRDPASGEQLTSRQKANRRVGYDFTFNAPKSLSLLYGLTGDERLLEAFRGAVNATMQAMEAEVETRVRVKGANEDRTTGNAVWGEYVHTTARPVEGVPDPHLHAHCFVFNATWDGSESRWKAGQFAGIKRDAPYFESLFHARLAHAVAGLGLTIDRTPRGWEIAGLSSSTLRRFSRRTELIEEHAREQGITDPKAKGALGAKTRGRKLQDLTMGQLRREWAQRLTDDERAGIAAMVDGIGRASPPAPQLTPEDAVHYAMAHCFERSAVVPERTLLAEALKRSLGSLEPERVAKALDAEPLIRATRSGVRLVTSDQVLAEEDRMVAFARNGRGACRELSPGAHAFKREWLNPEQRGAVDHVLHSRDRVMVIRGTAGAGKTSMMTEAVEAIEAAGTRVFTFAPSAAASRGVLRAEGFENADTVARLLVDERLQQEVTGQVLWVDEAGLLGSRTTAKLFDIAEKVGARLVLSGDKRQHGSVERGSTLHLLEREAGIVPAEIRDIQRQKGDYKRVVQALADGRIDDGVKQLDALGWIRESSGEERYADLARDYVAARTQGKSVLVVSPTHREGTLITQEIRGALRRDGCIGAEERQVLQLENANLTEAERSNPDNYTEGDVMEFHQNAKGILRGSRVPLDGGTLPCEFASRFTVYHSRRISLAAGDLVRITRGGMTADRKHRLNNGAVYRIKGFSERGDIQLANGWVIAKDFGHLAYGYVVTSHASQGKTVDRVLIGQSAFSMRAASKAQFYVSVSRAREQATIYTDDKAALLEAVSRDDDRMTATELADERTRREKALEVQRHQAQRAEQERQHERHREVRSHVR